MSWYYSSPQTLEPVHRQIFHADFRHRYTGGPGDLWHFRRILYKGHYPEGAFPSDLSLVNWPQIDYWLKPLLGVNEDVKQAALRECKQLSYSMLYWMQTEAPLSSLTLLTPIAFFTIKPWPS